MLRRWLPVSRLDINHHINIEIDEEDIESINIKKMQPIQKLKNLFRRNAACKFLAYIFLK